MEEFEVFTIARTEEFREKNKATFDSPHGIAIKPDGTIIIADRDNHKIRGIDPYGKVYTIAGTGERGDKDGPGNEATFNYPYGIAVRNDVTIIVADLYNNKIRGIDLDGNVFTIAGTGEEGDKDGQGNEATFYHPCGLAIKDDGTIIVVDTNNHKIRGIDLDGKVYTIAGTGVMGDKDGLRNEATFYFPSGITIRDDGTIIVSDTANRKIRGIDPDGNVFTIAGTGERGDKNGLGTEATFYWPEEIDIINDGTIIVSDSMNHKIRGIDLYGNVFTITGIGEEGDKDENGNETIFYYPRGIAIKNDGTIVISDTENNKIMGIRTKKLVKSAIE